MTRKHRQGAAAGAASPRRRAATRRGTTARQGVALLLVLAATLAGCAGASPPIRYHTLTTTPVPGGAVRYAGPPVVVRGVVLPAGFDRAEMTRELDPGAFIVRESDRWAAPLSRLARQVLVEDLALRLGPDAVVAPGGESPAARVDLRVDVLSYRVVGGVATAAVQWTLRTAPRAAATSPAPAEMRAERPQIVSFDAPVPADDPNADAAAWSALLATIADRVAAMLKATASPA